MKTYYAYDRRGDAWEDDCADLGTFEAATDAEALVEAAAIWPEEACAGQLRVAAAFGSNDLAAA